MHELIAPTVNLIILIGVLGYYLREPLKTFVRQRHVFWRDELAHVRELLQRARQQHGEFSAKLSAMDAEVTALRAQARQDAEASKQRLLAEAQRLAVRVVSDARLAAEGLFGELRGQLRSEMGAKVVTRAEHLLRERLTANDRARIRQEFSNQVESVR